MAKKVLLDIPMEMLQCITDQVYKDDLPSVRLACRTLDKAVFDRFVALKFAALRCWIFDPAEWTQVYEIISSPRLALKVKTVRFGTGYTEDDSYKHVHTARKETQETLLDAQCEAVEAFTRERLEALQNRLAGRREIRSIMTRLAENGIPITVDFHEFGNFHPLGWPVTREVFVEICRARNFVIHLSIREIWSPGMARAFRDYRNQMLAMADKIEKLEYEVDPGNVTVLQGDMRSLIRRPSKLREFTLCMCSFHSIDPANTPARQLLLANSFSVLQSLHLRQMWLEVPSLLHALQKCQATLRNLVLVQVELTKRQGNEWERVLRLITSMPRMIWLTMSELGQRDGELVEILDFSGLARTDQGVRDPHGCWFMYQFINLGIARLLDFYGLVFEEYQV